MTAVSRSRSKSLLSGGEIITSITFIACATLGIIRGRGPLGRGRPKGDGRESDVGYYFIIP